MIKNSDTRSKEELLKLLYNLKSEDSCILKKIEADKAELEEKKGNVEQQKLQANETINFNYKILGKVVQICKDDGEISLLRNTVFSKLQLDKMKEFQDVFSDPSLSQFVGEGGIKTTIGAPVIMIIPIAIYI